MAAGVGVALIPRLALTHVHPGIVVRALAPRSPARRVVAATIGAAGVAPGRRHDDRDPGGVAKRYTDTRGARGPAAAPRR